VRTRHLPALKKNSDVEIVAVQTPHTKARNAFCARIRWRRYRSGIGRSWLRRRISTSSGSAQTPYMHSAVTISALEAGKHVFCQARMSMDLAEAEEMLAASKRYPELVTSSVRRLSDYAAI